MIVSEMQDSKFDWIGLFHEGAFEKNNMIFCFVITFFTLYLIIIFLRISRYIFSNLSVIEFDWDVPGETFVKTAGSLVLRDGKIVPRGKICKTKNIIYCFFFT